MFCSKCGTQNPDGSLFCSSCGASLSEVPVSQPVQTQQAEFMQTQPVFPPQYGQQITGQPQQAAVKPPMNKKKRMIVIIFACSAVLAAFLIVLFTVIIPANTPRGKLKHVWRGTYQGNSITLDLKNNVITDDSMYTLSDWQVSGNLLTISRTRTTNTNQMKTETAVFVYSLSGSNLSLWDAGDYSPLDNPDIMLIKAG